LEGKTNVEIREMWKCENGKKETDKEEEIRHDNIRHLTLKNSKREECPK